MPSGYKVVVISVPGGKPKGLYVHHEVLLAFVGPRPEGMQVSHLNGDNSDNRLCNLVYESPKSNAARRLEHGTSNSGERNGAARLTAAQVSEIRALRAEGTPVSDLLGRYPVSEAQIYRIVRGENWTLDSE
jgi:hypothetical protein